MKNVKEFPKKEYIDYLLNKFEEIKDQQLIILKGHVLIEYMLNIYLSSHSNSLENDFSNQRFTFSDKTILFSFFGTKDEVFYSVYKAIRLFNSIRNNISHDLTYKVEDVENFVKYGIIINDYLLSKITNQEALMKSFDLEKIKFDGKNIEKKDINKFKEAMYNLDFKQINEKILESEPIQEAFEYRKNIYKMPIEIQLFYAISGVINYLYFISTIKTGNLEEYLASFPEGYNEEHRLSKKHPNLFVLKNKSKE